MKRIRAILLFLLPLLAISMGAWMYHAPLWQYQPLFLFLSFWLWVVMLRERKATQLHRYRKYILLALATGLLLWLGFPRPGWSPLLLVAFLPLLQVERDISLHHGRARQGEVFRLVFCSMVVWNILSTYWVANTSLGAGIFAVLANSLLMTLPWVLGHQARHHLPKLGYAPLVCFWLAFEYIHLRWDLSWPWLTLGNGFASFHSWVQWYDVLGALGGSLWIWICNILFFKLSRKALAYDSRPADYVLPLLAVALPVGYSWYQYQQWQDGKEQVDVVCIQPNQEPHYQMGNLDNLSLLEQCMEQAQPLMDSLVQYLVFPESTFKGVDLGQMGQQDIVRALQMMANMEYPGLNIIAGVTAYGRVTEKESYLPYTRKQISGNHTYYYQVSNGALYVHQDRLELYKKSKLVIGPEYIPFGQYLGFLDDWVSALGGNLRGFATQAKRGVFASEAGALGPVICYEQEYGSFMGGYAREGADFLAIITNDGWWGNTAGFRQHREFARLRAIEQRRSIARAANTGSSCFINARGDISQATEYEEFAAIRQKISLNSEVTTYARIGDAVGRFAAFLSLLFLGNMTVSRLIGKKQN